LRDLPCEHLRNTSGGLTFDLRKLKPDEHSRFSISVLNGKNQMPPWRDVLDTEQIKSANGQVGAGRCEP